MWGRVSEAVEGRSDWSARPVWLATELLFAKGRSWDVWDGIEKAEKDNIEPSPVFVGFPESPPLGTLLRLPASLVDISAKKH